VDVFPDEPESNGDAFFSPLQGLQNVLLTPHIGGSTQEAQENIGRDVSARMFNFLEKGISTGSLSIPALALPPQENAHRILHGEMPEGAADAAGDFFIVVRRKPEEAAETILKLVTQRIAERFSLDPKRDVQVLSPMHKGAAGTVALNQELQRALNPSGPSITLRGQCFRVGDKVMQIKNDYDRDVYNGDVGFVSQVDVEAHSLVVQFDGRDVTYQDAALETLTLAYAASIHKSQGSEYPAVVIPLLTSHFVMLSRNLVYTGVTRARKLCVLVADPRALALALGETRRELRATHLAQRLAT